jgi:pilus assembly protein CpaB
MARIRIFIVLALALVAGGTFAFGTYQYISATPKGGTVPGVKTINVLVAATDMDLGAEVRKEDVRAIQWPADAVPMGAFTNPNELVGRGLIQPVAQNEVFLPAKLASKEAGAGLPPVIPEGYRALSVRVNDVVGVAGYVLPGTRVDVVATVNPTNRPEDVQSKVVLTNVQVLAAGTKIERDAANNKPMAVSVVTLMVDPPQAERLTLASTEGKIQLALRNPTDKTAPTTAGIRPGALMGGYAPAVGRGPMRAAFVPRAAPVRQEPAAATVEIIRGDKRSREVVSQE